MDSQPLALSIVTTYRVEVIDERRQHRLEQRDALGRIRPHSA